VKLIQTILSGDPNFRFWPNPGESHPKAFIRLNDGQSLLQKAFLRGHKLPGLQEVLTVTNRELFFSTEDEYREVNVHGLPTNFMLEPMGRGTAPALIAAGLQVAQTHGLDALMLVLPADHLIERQDVFEAAVAQAVSLAEQGQWVALGVKPAGPETAYAYFELADQGVASLHNKPDLNQAKAMVSSGRHVWNTGIYCFSAATLLEQAQQQAPELLAAVKHCLQGSRAYSGRGVSQCQLDVTTFQQLPHLSIEEAVLEKSMQVALVTCDMGWSDIGQWAALGELTVPDAQGNRSHGMVVLEGASHCTVQAQGRPVGAVGVDGLLIVDTPEAVLVTTKQYAPQLSSLLAQLRSHGSAHLSSQVVHRHWGSYHLIHESLGFKIRSLHIHPGASLNLQVHQHRSEHWVVISGMAHIATGDQDIVMTPNRSAYIAAGQKHRLYNPGQMPCTLIEIQAGSYLGEDDVVRLEEKLIA
jgi:mannose-1-phosphate guanylyltransferase